MPGTGFFPRAAMVAWLAVSVLGGCGQSDSPPPPAPPAPTTAAAPASPGAAPAPAPTNLPDFSRLVETQGPAVVNVVTARKLSAGPGIGGLMPDDPLFDFFRRFVPDLPAPGGSLPGGPAPQARGLGSGFIISADGLVLTNAHVVAGASSVTIRLADGKREFPGKVLGADSRTDVALVKINATGLPVANLGNSTTVKPGQWVAAIGSPFGFANTITAGIVSATNREIPNESMVPFIQTDVAVNPGNSGGPLINAGGQVIGINSMIYSGTGGYMGVSFAIPIEVALDVAKQLQAEGKVTRGRLGVVIQPVTADLAQAFRLQDARGVLVSAVERGGPADRGGLKSGDVILEYNGTAITQAAELTRLVAGTKPGNRADVIIWRNAARQTVSVTVGEVPSETVAAAPAANVQPPGAANQLGLVVGEVPAALRERLRLDGGVLVQAVSGSPDSPIRPGDVILAVNQTRVANPAEFNRLLSGQRPGDSVALLVRRGEAMVFVALKVPAA